MRPVRRSKTKVAIALHAETRYAGAIDAIDVLEWLTRNGQYLPKLIRYALYMRVGAF